jgi:hypothetical protein
VPPLGALGAATGAIAIGMVATLTSTTKIISIATTISTATSVAKAATGSTIRNTGATPPTETGKQRTSLVVRVQGVRAELEIDQVVEALAHGPAVVELAHAQEGVELEHDPAAGPAHAQEVAELEHDPAAGPAHAQEVAELERGQVVEALAHGPAVVERVHDPVVAEPARDHPRAHLGVLGETRSVTAAHHRALAPLGEEDLAAAAETTHVPAATGAVVAWAAVE